MNETKTKMLPLWARTRDPLGGGRHRAAKQRRARWNPPEWLIVGLRLYGVAAGAVIGMLALTVAACLITAGAVRRTTTREVTEAVTVRMEAEMSRRLEAQAMSYKAEALLSDGAAMQREEEAEALAKLLYGYRNNSRRDLKTLAWCVLMRVDNPAYPGSVRAVVEQDSQWMNYSGSNPVRDDFTAIAGEILDTYHAGRYPAGLTSDFVYAAWSTDSIKLRDTWEMNSRTEYWRAAEDD